MEKTEGTCYQVHVREHRGNFGAKHSKKYCLDYSADWVVLLDDDITPDQNILDYCIRASYGYAQPIISVPGAMADHPWWADGVPLKMVRHILGWDTEESICLVMRAISRHLYWTCPNGVKTIMLCFFFGTIAKTIDVTIILELVAWANSGFVIYFRNI
jgi:hypothetical protein